MRTLRNIWSQLYRFVFWALISSIFWGWIFTLVTDTTPARKVTIYLQVEECRDRDLVLKLEENKPEGIRMVKVHPFSYAVFGSDDLLNADLYVVRESDAEEMLASFAPLDGESWDYGGRELFRRDGKIYGVKVYDAASDTGDLRDYLQYTPGENCYLFFNVSSPHLGGGDSAALRVAETMLSLSERERGS